LEYCGEPGRLRSLTRAPRPDILQRLDVRLPHQNAVSYASPDVRTRDMAIVPGTRTGCPYGVATSRPHGGANRAGARGDHPGHSHGEATRVREGFWNTAASLADCGA
jgi:hypothetical protein